MNTPKMQMKSWLSNVHLEQIAKAFWEALALSQQQ